MALPLLGLNVRLKGAAAKEYTLRYSATFVDGSAAGPVEEGMTCESPDLAALEAFQIELVSRKAKPAAVEQPVAERPAAPRPVPAKAPVKAPAKTPARPGRR